MVNLTSFVLSRFITFVFCYQRLRCFLKCIFLSFYKCKRYCRKMSDAIINKFLINNFVIPDKDSCMSVQQICLYQIMWSSDNSDCTIRVVPTLGHHKSLSGQAVYRRVLYCSNKIISRANSPATHGALQTHFGWTTRYRENPDAAA